MENEVKELTKTKKVKARIDRKFSYTKEDLEILNSLSKHYNKNYSETMSIILDIANKHRKNELERNNFTSVNISIDSLKRETEELKRQLYENLAHNAESFVLLKDEKEKAVNEIKKQTEGMKKQLDDLIRVFNESNKKRKESIRELSRFLKDQPLLKGTSNLQEIIENNK